VPVSRHTCRSDIPPVATIASNALQLCLVWFGSIMSAKEARIRSNLCLPWLIPQLKAFQLILCSRLRKRTATQRDWIIRTGRRPIRAVLVVLLQYGWRWANQSTSLPPVVSDFDGYQWEFCYPNVFQLTRLQYRAGLDCTTFSLNKAQRLVQLKKQPGYVIKGLNADF